MNKSIVGVDLFCGIGGLTNGLQSAGIDVRAGFDLDESCRFAYEKNNRAKFHYEDITTLNPKKITDHFAGAKHTLLAGCAPCQPFSHYKKDKIKETADHRWNLLEHFSRLVRQTKPTVISMENVPGCRHHPVYASFLQDLKELGYEIGYAGIVNCGDYGIPQNRKRLVVLASKKGMIKFLPPKDPGKTVREAIYAYQYKDQNDDPVHRALLLSAKNLERIKQSEPGGSWKSWNPALVSPCHGERGHSYTSSYGRMRWDAPAPTITTQFCYYGCGRFGHPERNRTITIREAALLQSFSQDYVFCEESAPNIRVLARQIGNAVPPVLGKIIGNSVKQHLIH